MKKIIIAVSSILILCFFIAFYIIDHRIKMNLAVKIKDSEIGVVMPEKYRHIYLGMSKKELRHLASHLEWDSSENSYYDENLNEKFCNIIKFTFMDFKTKNYFKGNELASICLYTKDDKKYTKEDISNFLTYCIKNFGQDYEVRLYTHNPSKHYLLPILYWKRTNIEIAVYYSHLPSAGNYCIIIYNPNVSYQSTIISEETILCNKKEIKTYFENILGK